MTTLPARVERDFLGEREIPAGTYWGVHTARALENSSRSQAPVLGPQAGFGELRLPARQAGSGIMPGKVNPVIPEMVNQVAFSVVGNDVAVTMAAEAGQLQLNAFEPVIDHCLLESIASMSTAFERLATQCVDGIEDDVVHLESVAGRSVGVVTALTPYIGYAAAADIVKAVLGGGGYIRDLVLATGLVDPILLEDLLHPVRLAAISTVEPPLLIKSDP